LKYRLQAVAIHIGDVIRGHYISCVKREDKWYFFNDEEFGEVETEKVMESMPYILFYESY